MKFLFKKSPIKLCCLNCSSLNKIKNKIKLEPIVEFGLEHSEQCCQCQLFGISRRFRLKCGNLQMVFVEIIFAININIAHYSCRTSSQTFFFKCNVVSSIAEYCIDYWLLQNQSMCVGHSSQQFILPNRKHGIENDTPRHMIFLSPRHMIFLSPRHMIFLFIPLVCPGSGLNKTKNLRITQETMHSDE